MTCSNFLTITLSFKKYESQSLILGQRNFIKKKTICAEGMRQLALTEFPRSKDGFFDRRFKSICDKDNNFSKRFAALINALEPKWKVMCSKTMKSRLKSMFGRMKVNLMQAMEGASYFSTKADWWLKVNWMLEAWRQTVLQELQNECEDWMKP